MMIRCDACGKYFDIVIAGKDSATHACPACGEVKVFNFGTFTKKAIEQSKKMFRKTRGGR